MPISYRSSRRSETKVPQSVERKIRVRLRGLGYPTREQLAATQCAACLGTLGEGATRSGLPVLGRDAMLALSCGHAMHVACVAKHAASVVERRLVESILELGGLDVREMERLEKVARGGAPCPLCRCEFPLGYTSGLQ